jgi:thioredoxin reductase
MSMHHAVLVSEWAGPQQMYLFLQGAFEPDDAQLAQLAARGITLERRLVTRVTDTADPADHLDVHLEGGPPVTIAGLFVLARTAIVDGFAAQLGCELEAGPLGAYYKTDAMTKETTVPGVFACGDAGQPMGSVSFAVADGARAGAGTHQSLVFRPAPA